MSTVFEGLTSLLYKSSKKKIKVLWRSGIDGAAYLHLY